MKQRLISALILAIIFIPLVILGGNIFNISLAVVSCLGLRELINLDDKYPKIMKVISYLSIIFLLLNNNFNIIGSLCIILLLTFLPIIFYDSKEYNYLDAIKLFSFITFLGLSFYLIKTIREDDIYSFIYLFIITILTDTFAYFAGKTIGKHKLIEKISPNKTMEGTLVGTIVAVIFSSIYYLYYIDPGQKIIIIWCISLLLSLTGQLGDLFFSSIKRYNNIKDFSNLLPGHGGVLDRLDSTIFVFIMYTIILSII